MFNPVATNGTKYLEALLGPLEYHRTRECLTRRHRAVQIHANRGANGQF
jgi:hypothetical protein